MVKCVCVCVRVCAAVHSGIPLLWTPWDLPSIRITVIVAVGVHYREGVHISEVWNGEVAVQQSKVIMSVVSLPPLCGALFLFSTTSLGVFFRKVSSRDARG